MNCRFGNSACPRRATRRAGGRHLSALGRLTGLGAFLAVTVALAGCGSGSPPYSLNPPGTGFMENYDPANVGQPWAFPAYLPVSKAPVTLVSARLLAIPGFPSPRLIHLGVWHIYHGIMAGAPGWPPHGCGGAAPCNAAHKPFVGFRLRPHDGQEAVYFWVVADRSGNYYAGGLRITYRVGTATYTGDLISGMMICARYHATSWKRRLQIGDHCNFSDKADAELTRISQHNH